MQDQERTMLAGVAPDAGRTQALPQAEATQMGASVECPVCRSRNITGDLYCWDCGFLLTGTPGEAPEALRGPSAKLVDPRSGRIFVLQKGVNTVGRQDTDVLLSDPSVSRRHATIEVRESDAVVMDTGSTNGTLVAGTRLAEGEQVLISAGQEIRFGSCALIFEMEAAQEPAAAEAPPDAEAPAPEEAVEGITPEQEPEGEERLEEPGPAESADSEAVSGQAVGILTVRETGERFTIGSDGASIGRRFGNDIVLSDAYVSGQHAIIAFRDGAFYLSDVGSTNGTLLNGVRLEPNVPIELSAGDEIRLGQLTLVFSVEEAG